MSSCLVLYIGVWQHSAVTPSALIPTLKLSHLEAIPVPITLLSNLQTLFSSCMLPLRHFQAARILYSSLLHTPTFLASSSILHSLLAKALVYLSFLPSSLVPATLSSSSLKLCPPQPHAEMLVLWGTELLDMILLRFVGNSSYRIWEGKLQIQEKFAER